MLIRITRKHVAYHIGKICYEKNVHFYTLLEECNWFYLPGEQCNICVKILKKSPAPLMLGEPQNSGRLSTQCTQG